MSKEARALLKKINDKKNAIRGLQGQGKTQEMKDRMAELREMQEEFDMLMEMEEDDDDGIKDSLHNGKAKEIEDGQKSKKYSKAQVCKAFVNRIVCLCSIPLCIAPKIAIVPTQKIMDDLTKDCEKRESFLANLFWR